MRSTSILRVLASGSPRNEPGPLADTNAPIRIGSAARAGCADNDIAATANAANNIDVCEALIIPSLLSAPGGPEPLVPFSIAAPWTPSARASLTRVNPGWSTQAHGDPAERADELGLSRAENAVELPVVRRRMVEKLAQLRFPGAGQINGLHAAIPRRAPARDQPPPLEIVERGRQGRLVAPARPAQRGLRQAGILLDQHQHGEAPRLEITDQGAPVSHLLDVLVQAEDVLGDLGVHLETCANEAAAAAMLG